MSCEERSDAAIQLLPLRSLVIPALVPPVISAPPRHAGESRHPLLPSSKFQIQGFYDERQPAYQAGITPTLTKSHPASFSNLDDGDGSCVMQRMVMGFTHYQRNLR
jgi:hypothetical protein